MIRRMLPVLGLLVVLATTLLAHDMFLKLEKLREGARSQLRVTLGHAHVPAALGLRSPPPANR